MTQETEVLLSLLSQDESKIATEWLQEAGLAGGEALRRAMQGEAGELLRAVRGALQAGEQELRRAFER